MTVRLKAPRYKVLPYLPSRLMARTDSDELNVNTIISRTARTGGMDDDERMKYRDRVTQMLAIVRAAIAVCR